MLLPQPIVQDSIPESDKIEEITISEANPSIQTLSSWFSSLAPPFPAPLHSNYAALRNPFETTHQNRENGLRNSMSNNTEIVLTRCPQKVNWITSFLNFPPTANLLNCLSLLSSNSSYLGILSDKNSVHIVDTKKLISVKHPSSENSIVHNFEFGLNPSEITESACCTNDGQYIAIATRRYLHLFKVGEHITNTFDQVTSRHRVGKRWP
jgi:hypothetical protein